MQRCIILRSPFYKLHITIVMPFEFYIAAVECKELHHPLNGRVEFPVPIVYQSEAVYTCDMGYNLVGNSSRYCLDDGVWGGTEPSCVGIHAIIIRCIYPVHTYIMHSLKHNYYSCEL